MIFCQLLRLLVISIITSSIFVQADPYCRILKDESYYFKPVSGYHAPYESCKSAFRSNENDDVIPSFECSVSMNETRFFLNDTRQEGKKQHEYLSMLMPDLAPYEENYCVDPFGGLDEVRREFLRGIFSKAFYLKECDLSNNTKSWRNPNKYIDRNQWIVLSHEAGHDLFRLKKFVNCETLPWEANEANAKHCYEPVQMPSRNAAHVPFDDKDGYTTRPEKPYSYPYNEPRPNTTFIQRDGKLIIQTPDMDAYGLYRCFDQQTKNQFKFAYFLIPITPIYFLDRKSSNSIHRGECGIRCTFMDSLRKSDTDKKSPYSTHCPDSYVYRWSEKDGLPSLKRPEYGDSVKYWRFDTFHRFRFLPPDFSDITAKFKSDWIMKCNANKTNLPAAFCNNGILDLVNNTIITPAYRDVKAGTEFRDVVKAINLDVSIQWTSWTSCLNGTKYRTRKGYCVLNKKNPSEKFEEKFSDDKLLPIYEDYKWIMKIHYFLENVDEFAKNGIRLFSGLMLSLIDGEDRIPYHCRRGGVNSFKEMFIDRIYEAFGEPKSNPCFFKKATQDENNPTEVIYGYPVFETRKCKK